MCAVSHSARSALVAQTHDTNLPGYFSESFTEYVLLRRYHVEHDDAVAQIRRALPLDSQGTVPRTWAHLYLSAMDDRRAIIFAAVCLLVAMAVTIASLIYTWTL